MVSQDSLLVTFAKLVDRLPMPTRPSKRGRGHPIVSSDRLFLTAIVIMIVRHLHTVHELLSVLAQPIEEMRTLRLWLTRAWALPNSPNLGATHVCHPSDFTCFAPSLTPRSMARIVFCNA